MNSAPITADPVVTLHTCDIFVRVLDPFRTGRRLLMVGDVAAIDSALSPAPGDSVLTPNGIERFADQGEVLGVVRGVFSFTDDIDFGASKGPPVPVARVAPWDRERE